MKLKRSIALITFCQLAFVVGIVSETSAQTKVAVIDIGLVFKNHPSFTQQLEQLKNRADQFKTQAQQTQQEFIQRAEVLKQYKKDSQEYRDIESKLAQESAELEVSHRAKMRDLLVAEAELHHATYNEVKSFIADFCQEQGIQVVLRYNSEPMQEGNQRSIMQKVNGSVVYYRNDKNITPIIIQRISQVKGSANRGTDTQNR